MTPRRTLHRFGPALHCAAWLSAALAAAVPAGAAELPGAMLLPESTLPDYERSLDHAGLIRGWNDAARQRGQQVFEFTCLSCHGDGSLPGSMPTALQFTSGTFQHGADPLTLYRTLTRGWRQMPPQVQLTPQEKYDVIHYIREAFLRRQNPTQLFPVDAAYLAALPAGDTRGPAPVKREPWREMDYGPSLIGTFEITDATRRAAALAFTKSNATADTVPPDANIAQKAIGVRLDPGPGGVAGGRAWIAFEHDTLRLAGAWTGEGFIDWQGINFDGRHVVRPRTVGELHVETPDGPGWADPRTGRFDDARLTGQDGRRFGPLPREWMRYRGLYRHGARTLVAYRVGEAEILESHDLEAAAAGGPIFVRTLNIARSPHDLLLRVAGAATAIAIATSPGSPGTLALTRDDRFATLRIRAADTPLRLALRLARPGTFDPAPPATNPARPAPPPPLDLAPFTRGGPAQWPAGLAAAITRSDRAGAFAWDRFNLPDPNPWRARLRLSGIAFSRDAHSAFVCTWDGDVWRIDGIDSGRDTVTWRRIASGLFQPLGLALRGDDLFVTCRDQLVRLHDLNADGETDFYEAFNSDHQVTEHFHEFAMGLQVDAAGNFYYAKSARHARRALVPQHGTLLKISADGARTEILATGFRAANGVCLNPDGTFFVTDQEGHWMPKNRINHVPATGGFYGNMWGGHGLTDASDAAMRPPLAWITNARDRSPAELLWVPPDTWGPLAGSLLLTSYGTGRLHLVPHESTRTGTPHGAVVELPLPAFPTGVMRGRFHPRTGDLYVAGLTSWATNQSVSGGLYRLRPTGQPLHLPIALHARPDGIALTFTEPLDPAVATELTRYTFATWTLRRSEKYGSQHHDERTHPIAAARLLDERTLLLTPADFAATQCFRLGYTLRDHAGRSFSGSLEGTLHSVGP